MLWGAVQRYRDLYGADAPVRVITSAIEHHAVLHTCRALGSAQAEITYLPVDNQGHVRIEDLERALEEARTASLAAGVDAPGAALVSIMLANNEVGTIQDVPALAAVAHSRGVPFHTDAVQAVGHIPVNVDDLGVDALSLSGHKFHGPRGIGALYLREGFSIPPFIEGGGQERGERAGTENVAGAVGMAAALEEANEGLANRMARVGALRDQLVEHVLATVDDVRYTGDPRLRAPPAQHCLICLQKRRRRVARGAARPRRGGSGDGFRLLNWVDRSLARRHRLRARRPRVGTRHPAPIACRQRCGRGHHGALRPRPPLHQARPPALRKVARRAGSPGITLARDRFLTRLCP